MRKSGLAHCCHHDIHWEYCYDYDKRVAFIKKSKPKGEQELRLRLFRIVPDDLLPGKDSPFAKYQSELDKIHNQLFPGCTWNGRSIFGDK